MVFGKSCMVILMCLYANARAIRSFPCIRKRAKIEVFWMAKYDCIKAIYRKLCALIKDNYRERIPILYYYSSKTGDEGTNVKKNAANKVHNLLCLQGPLS